MTDTTWEAFGDALCVLDTLGHQRALRLWASDVAERALPAFERDRPGDARPRRAIETARRFAVGDATREELDAARIAAKRAKGDALDAAAKAAARVATWAAWDADWDDAHVSAKDIAWVVAKVAAWDTARNDAYLAAWASEREWQAARLRWYLDGVPAAAGNTKPIQATPEARQICARCGNQTMRREEDSLYVLDLGPLCEDCHDNLVCEECREAPATDGLLCGTCAYRAALAGREGEAPAEV